MKYFALFMLGVALALGAGLAVDALPAGATICTEDTPQFCDTTTSTSTSTTTTSTTTPPPVDPSTTTTTVVPTPPTTVVRHTQPRTGWRRDTAYVGLGALVLGGALVLSSRKRNV
jgi:hypothetical protein